MLFDKKSRDDAVDYSLKSIRYICEEIGPRESGQANERKAQEWLQSELLNNGWADESAIEEFQVSRHGLVGFTKIAATLMLFVMAFQLIAYFVGIPAVTLCMQILILIFSFFTVLMTVLEFLMYKPFIDPLLPKSTSANVYAKYHSSGETKRRIIFSGHCDSAYEWALMKIKPAFMIVCLAGAIVGLLVTIALAIYSVVTGITPMWELILILVFTPFYISLYWMCRFKVVVPGANDNLTGVMASVAVLKCLKENNIRFENTEVDVVLTGSEEAGLRGAKAWAKKHKKEILDSNIETVFVGLETFRDWDYMCTYVRDMTSTVKHDAGVIKLIDRASENCGRKLQHANVFFGASDAAAVTKEGLRATCIAGMDPTPADYYHNVKDNADNMDRKTFAFGLDIALEAIEIFDKEGALNK